MRLLRETSSQKHEPIQALKAESISQTDVRTQSGPMQKGMGNLQPEARFLARL